MEEPIRGAAVGRNPQISREAVLTAALRLADEQGLEAVTMHAVAKVLNVTPMALYRHVDDKNALLDGLVELLLTEYPSAADSSTSPSGAVGAILGAVTSLPLLQQP